MGWQSESMEWQSMAGTVIPETIKTKNQSIPRLRAYHFSLLIIILMIITVVLISCLVIRYVQRFCSAGRKRDRQGICMTDGSQEWRWIR